MTNSHNHYLDNNVSDNINDNHHCPLCHTLQAELFHQDRHKHHPRDYYRCQTCWLVFVPPYQFLSSEAEKAEYSLHQNSPADQGYRHFLNRIYEPMQARLTAHSEGLDFGAGPGPTLSVMFQEVGHTIALYDPFYAHDPSVFEQSYDFITATEVVEHLHRPAQEFERLWRCLRPGGLLGIMTKLVLDQTAFVNWHYKNDLTHVCFFSHETFRWLADQWQSTLTFEGQDAIIFIKD